MEKPSAIAGCVTDKESKIYNLVWKEVAIKSPSATIGFSLVAVAVFIWPLSLTENSLLIRFFCLLSLLSNVIRFSLGKNMVLDSEIKESKIKLLKISIWANAFSWSVIFCLGLIKLPVTDINFVLIISLICGFSASSLVTLGYHLSLYLPFQILILLPLILISFYKGFFLGIPGTGFMSLLFTFFLFYQFRQYRTYRGQVLQRFHYEIDLENSFQELKESKEAFMEQTAKLIHASKISALGEMAGGLAHEVNNSLQVVIGSYQQVHRILNKTGKSTDEIEQKFEKSNQAIHKIKSVIDGLKYFSQQMETSEKLDVSLNDVVERTLNYTQELITAHGIQFKIGKVPDVIVHCQPIEVTQILFGLIKNADDALKRSETKDRWIDLYFKTKDGYIEIVVTNGGPAIPQEVQAKLFQPFFTTKDVNQGTGLSLSIARGMALDHHGDLYYDDAATDTSFVLKLPFKRK